VKKIQKHKNHLFLFMFQWIFGNSATENTQQVIENTAQRRTFHSLLAASKSIPICFLLNHSQRSAPTKTPS